ncbi:MAG: fumarate hydratase [Candidatus Ratteibacteria bacterium]|jgi:fumarate hydratase subunit alpha
MKQYCAETIIEVVERLVGESHFSLEPQIQSLISTAALQEEDPFGRKVLNAIIENIAIASRDRIPMCQDTGMALIFFSLGINASIDFCGYSSLQALADEGVRRASSSSYLRRSVVSPRERKNTGDNTPAIVWIESVPGDTLEIRSMIKGFGSENTTRLFMLSPSSDESEIIHCIVETVKKAGSNPCPPIFLGIGIGGTSEKALLLSKEALFLTGESRACSTSLLETRILQQVNALGIGPGGLGGRYTCLDVRVKEFPTHIAGLPLAVSISCWAHRTAREVLS